MATLNAAIYQSRADAEAHYLGLCDLWASEKRRVDPAQESIYQAKYQEALMGGGEWIYAEAGMLCIDASHLCEQIKAAHLQQQNDWFESELKRIKAKSDIRSAQTPADMHAIVKQLESN